MRMGLKKPVGQASVRGSLNGHLQPIPALAACRLAYSWPLIQPGGVREVGAELDEERAEVIIRAVEV
jgi:hypothetical protein